MPRTARLLTPSHKGARIARPTGHSGRRSGGFVTGRAVRSSGSANPIVHTRIVQSGLPHCHISSEVNRTSRTSRTHTSTSAIHFISTPQPSKLSLLGANSPSLTHGICNAYTSLHSANIIHLFPTICSGMQRSTSAKRCKEV